MSLQVQGLQGHNFVLYYFIAFFCYPMVYIALYKFHRVLLYYTCVLQYIRGGHYVSSDIAGTRDVWPCEAGRSAVQMGGCSAPHHFVSPYIVLPELRCFADEDAYRMHPISEQAGCI